MSTTDLASPEKKQIREFFDAIAPRYDFLNTFLSFRMDDLWRRKALARVLKPEYRSVLDLGIGTGKFLKLFLEKKSWKQAVGLDFSQGMLVRAREDLKQTTGLVSADFHDLPFLDESFDLIVSSFTLRSVKDIPRFLSEVNRVLRPGGTAAFLCLTRPKSAWMRGLYFPYLKYYLPSIGRVFSRHEQAYSFLSESIQNFQAPEVTLQMMRDAGFQNVNGETYTFGAATLFRGEK